MDFLPEKPFNRHFMARIFAVIIFTLVALLAPQNAYAENLRKYAGIVVDAKTGKTLYSHAADATRYPASVAKVMTIYIAFEEIESGRMSMNTKLKVSKYAAAAEPTKLYLKPGTTITLEDAINALITKSANDAARVIAENISGSVPAFADRMTKTARALGMSRTTYKNPSGLPNSQQRTTVRDQARLGMAIFQHYPQYFNMFKTRAFRYRGNTYGNHNRLLGTVTGVDGIKTGYTRASGHNLLTSARHGNRHIIVAAFGFDSGASRNAKVSELVKKYLPKGHKGDYWRQASIGKPGSSGNKGGARAPVIAVALSGLPPVRPNYLGGNRPPEVPQPINVAATPEAPIPAPIVPEPTIEPEVETIQVAALETPIAAPNPPARPIDLLAGTSAKPLGVINLTAPVQHAQPIAQGNALQPLNLLGNLINRGSNTRQPAPVAPPGLVPPSNITDPTTTSALPTADIAQSPELWTIQVGAVRNQDQATELLSYANDRLSVLKDYRPAIQDVTRNGQTFYRARFVGFATEAEATKACNALKEKKVSCLAMPG